MTGEEIVKIAKGLRTDFKCESDIMVDFCNSIIKELEQEPTTKNDLGVDCISRAQVQTEIEMNASRYTIAKERGGMGQVEWSDQLIKVSDAIDIIRNLPPITPQEPFINKACVSSKVCEHDKEVVLDKIRAEIEKQEKWLLQAGYNAYNVDIAFYSIKLALAESENEE